MLYRRMAHFYHLVYLSGTFISSHNRKCNQAVFVFLLNVIIVHTGPASQPMTPELAHVPDVFTFDGIVDLLTLANLFEMAPVISYETYSADGIPEYDKRHFIQARELCRDVIHWLQRHFRLIGVSGETMDIHEIWYQYLSRQVKAVSLLKHDLEEYLPNTALSGNRFEDALNACFKDHIEVSQHTSANLCNWIPDTLNYPNGQDFYFCVELR